MIFAIDPAGEGALATSAAHVDPDLRDTDDADDGDGKDAGDYRNPGPVHTLSVLPVTRCRRQLAYGRGWELVGHWIDAYPVRPLRIRNDI